MSLKHDASEMNVKRKVANVDPSSYMLCMARNLLGSFAIDIISRQICALHHVIILLYVLIINCRESNTRINDGNQICLLNCVEKYETLKFPIIQPTPLSAATRNYIAWITGYRLNSTKNELV